LPRPALLRQRPRWPLSPSSQAMSTHRSTDLGQTTSEPRLLVPDLAATNGMAQPWIAMWRKTGPGQNVQSMEKGGIALAGRPLPLGLLMLSPVELIMAPLLLGMVAMRMMHMAGGTLGPVGMGSTLMDMAGQDLVVSPRRAQVIGAVVPWALDLLLHHLTTTALAGSCLTLCSPSTLPVP